MRWWETASTTVQPWRAPNLGLAVGSGTDVALESADLIVIRDNLTAVPIAITLARRTFLTIRTNLVWAFGYNVIAIPLAAFGFLNPLIAGAAMALSSGCVVWNSSRLRHFSTDVERQASERSRTCARHGRSVPCVQIARVSRRRGDEHVNTGRLP